MTTTLPDTVCFPPAIAGREPLPPREFAEQIRRNVLAGFCARFRDFS